MKKLILINKIQGILYRNNPIKYLLFKIFKPKLKYLNDDIRKYHVYFKMEQPFLKYTTTRFEGKINTQFNDWSKSGEPEYIIHYAKKCTIEPFYNWALDAHNRVIKKSLPYGETESTPLPNYIFYKRKRPIKLDTAICISYNWFNYWHFYNDILGQLYVLDKQSIDVNIPILIPEKALKLPYVKELFNKVEYLKKGIGFYTNQILITN